MPEHSLRQLSAATVKIATRGWLLIAGGGGSGLLILQSTWPPAHGRFAMSSGIAACPPWPTFPGKHAHVALSSRAQLATVILLVIAGRVAPVVERHLGMPSSPTLD